MRGDLSGLFSLAGEVALITGGGQGLGRAMAEGLARFGAAVSVVDVQPDAAQAVAEGITAAGGQAIAVECDVSSEAQVQTAIARTVEALGKIDVLIANAGISARSPAEEMTSEQWDRVMAINLRGIWLFDQETGKHMIRRGQGGRIIYFLGNIPLGRLGEVEDIVGPAVFLASPASAMVTGHVLSVDGGHTAA
jgi:NAD(P)-dependent dehydrogenase (short-subunit alcohol dehydrogenase family)